MTRLYGRISAYKYHPEKSRNSNHKNWHPIQPIWALPPIRASPLVHNFLLTLRSLASYLAWSSLSCLFSCFYKRRYVHIIEHSFQLLSLLADTIIERSKVWLVAGELWWHVKGLIFKLIVQRSNAKILQFKSYTWRIKWSAFWRTTRAKAIHVIINTCRNQTNHNKLLKLLMTRKTILITSDFENTSNIMCCNIEY